MLAAACTWSGLALVGVTFLFHPPVLRLADSARALGEIAHSPLRWQVIHAAALLGFIQLAIGVPSVHRLLAARGPARFSPFAAAAFFASLPLWAVTLSAEIVTLPRLVAGGSAPQVADAISATALFLGYLASGLQWSAVTLWGFDFRRQAASFGVLGWWALSGGALALVALPLGAALLRGMGGALLFLALQAPAVAWLAAIGFLFLRRV